MLGQFGILKKKIEGFVFGKQFRSQKTMKQCILLLSFKRSFIQEKKVDDLES